MSRTERSSAAAKRQPVYGGQNSAQVSMEPSAGFVVTPSIQAIVDRARVYLNVGYPVHLSGPPGTGKTTLAFHIAAQSNRPVTLIHGDDEFGSSDLVGRNVGYQTSKVVDNYIHSVLRTREEHQLAWQDSRLTVACREGHILIYDEFTRSRPEANNALLSVLEERLLNLGNHTGESYIGVHPRFQAIFTSNPEEYAGVHRTQDALMDRLITIRLDLPDRETEVAITMARSELDRESAERIVDLVRRHRNSSDSVRLLTIRACIAIARILVNIGKKADPKDELFRKIYADVTGVYP